MVRIKLSIFALSLLFTFFRINADTEITKTQSANIENSYTVDMKNYQSLYISGAVCTYSAVLANLISASNGGLEIPFITSISFGAISPVLIHIGQGKAKNKAEKIVELLPENHELRDEYQTSRFFYFSGFAPMAGAIIFSSAAMPATFLSDDKTLGPTMYGLAFLSLITRDLLWGRAMKGYKNIAQNAPVRDKKIQLSISPRYDSNNKSGGMAFNLHF